MSANKTTAAARIADLRSMWNVLMATLEHSVETDQEHERLRICLRRFGRDLEAECRRGHSLDEIQRAPTGSHLATLRDLAHAARVALGEKDGT